MDILEATLMGYVVGILGTVLGGIIILRSTSSRARQSWLLGISGGIMMAVVLFDLWPDAHFYGGVIPALLGTVIGLGLINYFEKLLKFVPGFRQHSSFQEVRLGILLGVGIGVHNFPEGVALGSVYVANQLFSNWGSLATLMAVHNIPEGMVIASSLKLGGIRAFRIITVLLLVELPMAGGALLGALLGKISGWMMALALGFAGGAMFLLVLQELLPLAKRLGGLIAVLTGFALGMLGGIILIKFTSCG